jgi:hypothetical protein
MAAVTAAAEWFAGLETELLARLRPASADVGFGNVVAAAASMRIGGASGVLSSGHEPSAQPELRRRRRPG